MSLELTYRGIKIGSSELAFIRELIAAHPVASRWLLSKKLCEAWDWRQANGALRDQVCRSLMLKLHREGHLVLPAKKMNPKNNLARRKNVCRIEGMDETPLCLPLRELGSLELQQVRRTEHEQLFNSLIETHHYLGYCQPVGEHLKYLIRSQGRVIACMAWGSAPWHVGCRDRYIGWTAQERRRNMHHITCNTRFLILPWVQVKCLASHILGQMTSRLANDWMEIYGHPLYYLETFVDIERFAGTCYRAANWICIGQTTGRWRQDKKKEAQRHIKDIYGYPLDSRFRHYLCGKIR